MTPTIYSILAEMEKRVAKDEAEIAILIQPERGYIRDTEERKRLFAALRLAIEQRDRWMGDFTLDRYEKIQRERAKADAQLAMLLEGKGHE